jgi:hypothetical protein
MPRIVLSIAILIACGTTVWAKSSTDPIPQTARQALMEMFSGKQPDAFLSHLPAVTRAALEQSGALANIQQYSALAGQMQTQGKKVQAFDTGSIMLTTEDPKTGQKVDVVVEQDNLHGDQDDIELSFQTYRNGQAERAALMPHVTFSMKMESGFWKLNEISMTINLPLTDPVLLKGIADSMKPRVATTLIMQPSQPQNQQSFGSDANILGSMRTILTAEVTYAATYPTVGFTCTLSDLDGFGGGEPNEHQAMLVNSGLASGHWRNYSFSLSGCSGTPATSFHLMVSPIGQSYGRRSLCSDQSGVIRSAADGNANSCISNGTPVQ